MFSELHGNYKEQIIRYRRRYANDKFMIVDTPAELYTVLADKLYATTINRGDVRGKCSAKPEL